MVLVSVTGDSGKVRGDQMNKFFTKKSTGKGTRTFAHGLTGTPSMCIAYSLKNVTKIAFAFTFGATNVIINNPSLTAIAVIMAIV